MAMSNGCRWSVVVVVLVLLQLPPVSADVTCTAGTSGTLVAGGTGFVSCNFGLDVSKGKHNFNVVQYGKLSNDSGNYVLMCNWMNGELVCTLKDGYKFDKQVGDSLRLDIPTVEEKMAGMYVCQLVPDNNIVALPCNLTVTHKETNDHSPQPKGEPIESSTNGFLVPFVITLLLLLLVTGVFVYFLVKHKPLQRKWPLRCMRTEETTGDDDDPEMTANLAPRTVTPGAVQSVGMEMERIATSLSGYTVTADVPPNAQVSPPAAQTQDATVSQVAPVTHEADKDTADSPENVTGTMQAQTSRPDDRGTEPEDSNADDPTTNPPKKNSDEMEATPDISQPPTQTGDNNEGSAVDVSSTSVDPAKSTLPPPPSNDDHQEGLGADADRNDNLPGGPGQEKDHAKDDTDSGASQPQDEAKDPNLEASVNSPDAKYTRGHNDNKHAGGEQETLLPDSSNEVVESTPNTKSKEDQRDKRSSCSLM